MKFTYTWLQEHLDTNFSISEIADALLGLGLEVENIENCGEKFNGFFIGYVEKVETHPNADRLNLCQINDGQGIYQVVCGAKNVREGLKIAFARPGAIIPSTGQPLKTNTIRGIESQGMICSAEELLLEENSEGILELNIALPVGLSLSAALEEDETIIHVSLTPNRSDCFSVRGIARDLAAAGYGILKPLNFHSIKEEFSCPIKVTLEDEACPYFTGRMITGLKNGPSPLWLKKRLELSGQRSISAVIDITNYICLTLGQPLHAFDASKIHKSLRIGLTIGGEKFLALNEQTYPLSSGMIAVKDHSEIISLAGIMGGKNTGCNNHTTEIFLEAAYFNPSHIAQAGQTLSLLSESRTRFERGIDPKGISKALNWATELILKYCGGSSSSRVTVGKPPVNSQSITLTQEKLTQISGDPNIVLEQAKTTLEKLGLEILYQDVDKITVVSPSWRHDLKLDVDLIEEILRIKGYQHIPCLNLPPQSSFTPCKTDRLIRKTLCQKGLDEIYSWSLTESKLAFPFTTEKEINLTAPLTQEMAVLRPSLLIGLLKALSVNQAKSQPNGSFFEIAHTFKNCEKEISEHKSASGVRSQLSGPRNWLCSPRSVDCFDVKSDVIDVLSSLNVKGFQIENCGPSYYHPGRRGTFKQGSKSLAYFGEIHPKILSLFHLIGPVVAFEILLENISPFIGPSKIKPLDLSPFQPVTRDYCFIIPETVEASSIIKTVKKTENTLIKDIQIFDVYDGDRIEKGKKSIALEILLQASDRTLNEEDLKTFSQKIVEAVAKNCQGILRGT